MLKTTAHILSILFHPLLIITYMLILLLLVNPYQFGVHTIGAQWKLLILVFLSTFIMPAFAVFIMRAVGLVASMELEDRYDRIGPYIITGIFYLWIFINFKSNPLIPKPFTIAVLGAVIALFGCFFINNFTKISAHAAGMGGLTGMVAVNTVYFNFDTFTLNLYWLGAFEMSTSFVLMAVILMTGFVSTARLYLGAHTSRQLYGGLVVGFASQWIALAFFL